MDYSFSFDQVKFSRLFPFYILISRDLEVKSIGGSLQKLLGKEYETSIEKLFVIPRPFTPISSFQDLKSLQNQLVILESKTLKVFQLRGQFEYLEVSDEILFVGSPWFGSIEKLNEHQLVLDDFARHDPLIDMLHVVKAQEITNDDLKELLSTISHQKNELKKANQEVYEIALFPTQNPDPLICINFDGDILRNNPAASKLDFIEFEEKLYRNDEFFKIVSKRIDKEKPRWVMEAKSGNVDYSLVCITMLAEGYINIYGRDITEQKKSQKEKERLSLVASANENGVLFTDAEGNISWVNEGFCKLTGYLHQELIGQQTNVVFLGSFMDHQSASTIKEIFKKGKSLNTEIIFYRKDKSWFWGRFAFQPIRSSKGEVSEYFGIIQNISEEKANEEKLKVLSQIAEDNINAVVIANAEGKITWTNKSFIKMTGYSLEESYGKTPGSLLQGPATDKNTVDYLRNQVKKGENFNAEIINYSKSGKKYWLRVQGQAIKNDKGEVTGFFALEEDITKERESEQLFRKALENIGDNVWEHDFKTGRTYFSKSQNEFLGYNTNENTNNQSLWWSSVNKEDIHLLEKNNEEYQNGQRDSHSLEYRITDKVGNTKWVLDRGVVIEKDREGKPLRITGTHTDITERKEFEQTLRNNEEKYRGIITNMNLGLMELDLEGRIVFANQMLLDMAGLDHDSVLGFDSTNFLSQKSKAIVKERMANRAKGISEAYEIQVEIKNKSLWWFLSSAPKYLPTGEHVGSTVVCLDITAQKQLEKDLIKSREQAEQLTKAKETFLANMSHEIRTPMNAIMGMGKQLAKTPLDEQQRFFLQTINKASENLLVIINDILDLSKIEAGKLIVEKISFEPRKIVAEASRILMYKAEEKGLKLTNSFCDSRLSPVLIGDPYRLNQVLLNLISNAIKFTEKGFVDITCEVVEETTSTQTILAKVTDTGIGMEKEFAEKLFDKFSQEYESTSRRFGGTGLGMSICKELIELMGGTISVNSVKNEGTVISFQIEFEKGTMESLDHEEPIQLPASLLSDKTILVTDDNEMNRLVAGTILRNYDVKILEAANGMEALKIIENQDVDLVLLDIQMPILNGYETIKQLRAKGNEVPVIALTANAIKGESEKCIAAGMNNYIAKPFNENEFLQKIANCLDAAISQSEVSEAVIDDAPLYSLTALEEISRGNVEFIKKMVTLFCETAPLAMSQIQESYHNHQLESMGAAAHKIKPSIDNLRIEAAKELVRAIEKCGKEKVVSNELEKQIAILDDIINRTVEQLKHNFA